MRFRIFCLTFVLGLAGCAGSGPQGPFSLTKLPPLEEDEGYIAFGFDGNVGVHELRYQESGSNRHRVLSERILSEDDIRVYRMPAGDYRFSRVTLFRNVAGSLYLSPDENEELWDFQVVPGKLNYLGELHLHVFPSGAMRLERMNHSAQFYQKLEERAPVIISDFEIVFSGIAPDAFFEWVNDLQSDGEAS